MSEKFFFEFISKFYSIPNLVKITICKTLDRNQFGKRVEVVISSRIKFKLSRVVREYVWTQWKIIFGTKYTIVAQVLYLGLTRLSEIIFSFL